MCPFNMQKCETHLVICKLQNLKSFWVANVHSLLLQYMEHMDTLTKMWIIPSNGKQLRALSRSNVDLSIISSLMHNS